MNRSPLHLLRSWGKQEARALTPWQRRWLQRGSLVLALGLCGLALQRHHALERQRRDAQLQQGIELAAVQWSTLRASAYDWAHWDETHAFARGKAPGYPARNLKAASGLSSVAPVVMIIDRGGVLLTLQGRRGPSSWAQDPLVRCSQAKSTELLAAPQTLGIYCRDQEENRLWIGVIEPITDTAEQESISGLMVLLAPLRHPSHGPAMHALMQSLERQMKAAEPGPQSIKLDGQLLWGPDRQVLNLSPEPVLGQTVSALRNDLNVVLPFLLSLLGLRAGLMLQGRRTMLLERQQQKRSQQRLRRARRRLERQFADLPYQQREQALRLLTSGRRDPIDDLARELEVYALALHPKQGTLASNTALQFEPMRDCEGQLQRVRLYTEHATGIELYQQAIEAWSNLPSGVRCNLGLQLDLSRAAWSNTHTVDELKSILQKHNMPPQCCTIGIENSNTSADELRQHLPVWRNAGFALSLLYAAGLINSASWLYKRWFDEVQILIPALNHPSLSATQQELICALIQLAQSRDLKVAIRGLQKPEQLAWLSLGDIDLTAGPLIGRPMHDLSELLIEQKLFNTKSGNP
jgi:EAL domain-containing protein (putative c-di-GMP-specific phosphodiesterase class I)